MWTLHLCRKEDLTPACLERLVLASCCVFLPGFSGSAVFSPSRLEDLLLDLSLDLDFLSLLDFSTDLDLLLLFLSLLDFSWVVDLVFVSLLDLSLDADLVFWSLLDFSLDSSGFFSWDPFLLSLLDFSFVFSLDPDLDLVLVRFSLVDLSLDLDRVLLFLFLSNLSWDLDLVLASLLDFSLDLSLDLDLVLVRSFLLALSLDLDLLFLFSVVLSRLELLVLLVVLFFVLSFSSSYLLAFETRLQDRPDKSRTIITDHPLDDNPPVTFLSGRSYSHESLVLSREGDTNQVTVDPQSVGQIIIHQLLSIRGVLHLNEHLKTTPCMCFLKSFKVII